MKVYTRPNRIPDISAITHGWQMGRWPRKKKVPWGFWTPTCHTAPVKMRIEGAEDLGVGIFTLFFIFSTGIGLDQRTENQWSQWNVGVKTIRMRFSMLMKNTLYRLQSSVDINRITNSALFQIDGSQKKKRTNQLLLTKRFKQVDWPLVTVGQGNSTARAKRTCAKGSEEKIEIQKISPTGGSRSSDTAGYSCPELMIRLVGV